MVARRHYDAAKELERAMVTLRNPRWLRMTNYGMTLHKALLSDEVPRSREVSPLSCDDAGVRAELQLTSGATGQYLMPPLQMLNWFVNDMEI